MIETGSAVIEKGSNVVIEKGKGTERNGLIRRIHIFLSAVKRRVWETPER